MQFTPIDLQTWPRGQMVLYFSRIAPTGYSITVDIDVTGLRASLKKRGFKFFPSYLWLVTKCLNEQVEFKAAQKDNILGYYDTLTPLYASFHDDDKTFSLMWTEYDTDLSVFLAFFPLTVTLMQWYYHRMESIIVSSESYSLPTIALPSFSNRTADEPSLEKPKFSIAVFPASIRNSSAPVSTE